MSKTHLYRIARETEDEYDQFLDSLFKRKQKKQKVALAAEQDYKNAVKEKKPLIGQKLKKVFEDIGGVEGASGTIQNILGMFREEEPEDYEIGIGSGADKEKDKKILGLSPTGFYTGAAVVTVVLISAVAIIVKSSKQKQTVSTI